MRGIKPVETMKKNKVELCLLLCLMLLVSSVISGSVPTFMPFQGVFNGLFRYFAVFFVLLHSYVTVGPKKTALLSIISFSAGLISEYLGTAYGLIYGEYYYTGV